MIFLLKDNVNVLSMSTRTSLPFSSSNKNYHQIIPNLFLGNYHLANDLELLKKLGITHILNCSIEHPNYFPNDFVYLHLHIHDDPSFKISQHFQQTRKFIDSAKKIYVHCHAGISRSSTIVIYYLMKKFNSDLETILSYVQNIREVVQPNEGFLLELERESLC